LVAVTTNNGSVGGTGSSTTLVSTRKKETREVDGGG
jgi:hypothetical protein